MASKKKAQGGKVKPQYFKDIYEQMLADETKSFWDLAPVQNTLIGRTISHVMFRRVGVSISHYFTTKVKNDEELPSVSENKDMADVAEMEFLSAWNNVHQTFATLQMEALSFRALLTNRDYELWLAQTLSKIPIAQWDKQKQTFTQMSGNPAYIVAYGAWKDAMRGRKFENPFSWLPTSMTVLEKYIISRTVKGYILEPEIVEKIAELRTKATTHGLSVMEYTQGRVNRVFGGVSIVPRESRGHMEIGMTETGQAYYEHAAVLWGLWGLSAPQVLLEGETVEDGLPSLVNGLTNGFGVEIYSRLRTSFLSEWSHKFQKARQEVDDEEDVSALDEANKEIEKLTRELRHAKDKVEVADKELVKQKETYESLEKVKLDLVKRNTELEAKLKTTEKKLAKALTNKAIEIPSMVDQVTPVKVLEKKIVTLENNLHITNTRIDDIFSLLLLEEDEGKEEDIGDEIYDNYAEVVEEDVFDEAVKSFTGRIIINGGAKNWQDRTRKWFEDRGVKVRTYDLGAGASGVRKTDVVIMNVIQNKHKYSVKFMNEVRCVGAKLLICSVNNVEQTLRVVFDRTDHKSC